jgi:hypothetical protein
MRPVELAMSAVPRASAPRGGLRFATFATAIAVMLSMGRATAQAQPAPAPPAPTAPTATAPTAPAPTAPAPTAPAPTAPAPTAPVGQSPAVVLRQANAAAQLGDWSQVEQLTSPLAPAAHRAALAPVDAAEVHRLLGLAAFFTQRLGLAESELWAYLQIDLDAHLDPATVPPEAITFFESIQAKHRAELRALREQRTPKPPPRRSFLLTLVPVAGQLQNRQPTKAWALGITLGALAITNVTSYVVLRRWCREGDGTCDRTGVDHSEGAKTVSVINVLSGVGLVVTYGVAVGDAILGYRRTLQVAPVAGRGNVGVSLLGSF